MARPKVKGTDIEISDMLNDPLDSFSPDNSPGMRARLDAIAQHRAGKPLNELGQEMPDPTPVAPPIGYVPQPTLREQIRAMVQSEALAYYADQQGQDTFEEADDFDVDDDDEFSPNSPWEQDYDPLPPGELSRRRQQAYAEGRGDENQPDPAREVQPEQKPSPKAPQPAAEGAPAPVPPPSAAS